MALEFVIRQKVLSILGTKFHIYNSAGDVVGFCKQKAFKLKEDIRLFTDDSATEELITIQARSIIDFSAAYDVVQSDDGKKLGAYKRRGGKSFFRDSWIILDENENEVGQLQEDSMGLALLRRFALGRLLPQKFHLEDSSGKLIASYQSHFNPFINKMTVTIEDGAGLDPFLLLSGGVLLMVIEGKQDS